MVSNRMFIAFLVVGAMLGGCSGLATNPSPDLPVVKVRISGSAEFLYNFCNSLKSEILAQANQASDACSQRNKNNSEDLIFTFDRQKKAIYTELLNVFLTTQGSSVPTIQFSLQSGCVPIMCSSGFKGWFPKPQCPGCPQ